MLVKLLVLYCLVANCVAWLAPERCAQNKVLSTLVNSTLVKLEPLTDLTIEDIAAIQHEKLEKKYKNYKFESIPIRAELHTTTTPVTVKIHAPYNCSFNTYNPRLLSSVVCNGVSCKLSRTVTTTDSYTASEGYNWGVKLSSKAKFSEFFEAGGETSTGGTYSCTYNKGRTTSDLVECLDNTNTRGHLLLYNVQSDMRCDFGEITLESDKRDGVFGMAAYLTSNEITEINNSMLDDTYLNVNMFHMFLIDMDKISDRLLNKIKKLVPHYNPYTDFISAYPVAIQVSYFKKINSVEEYRRIIPFTNEDGDSIYQYACTKEAL